MAKLILSTNNQYGNTSLYEEDGKLYKTQTADYSKLLDYNKERRTEVMTGRFNSRGSLREAANIPIQIYWNLMEKAEARGIPAEEREKFVFKELKSPEFDYFWVDPTLKGKINV